MVFNLFSEQWDMIDQKKKKKGSLASLYQNF